MRAINVMPCMQEWYDRHIVQPHRAEKARREKLGEDLRRKIPIVRTPATPEELRALAAISRVTFCPGTGSKRFARQMQGAKELTDGQRGFLWSIVYRFRRQITDQSLISIAKAKTTPGGA